MEIEKNARTENCCAEAERGSINQVRKSKR